MWVHSPESGKLWVIPITSSTFLASRGGNLSVFGSRNGARFPQRMAGDRNAHLLVLRERTSADWADPTGASSGQLVRTRDEGGEWGLLAGSPPPLYPVKVFGRYG